MRKLIVSEFISLDGVIQAPGGPREDPGGGFRLGGWIVPYAGEAITRYLHELFEQPFDLLLGRGTYDIFAGYWPHVPADSPSRGIADLFNSVPKHVATHRPETLGWRNSRAIGENLADAMRALKKQDGSNLLTFGSGNMVGQLLAADLVDELRLLIYPVILGHGKRLFAENAPASAFRLTQSVNTSEGVIITRYVRDGEVRTGSFDTNDQESV